MLVIKPNFSIPEAWENRTEKVLVITPDGLRLEASGEFSSTHVNISDPTAPIDQRWRITLWLTDRTKDEVPIGSKIFVSQELKDALVRDAAS